MGASARADSAGSPFVRAEASLAGWHQAQAIFFEPCLRRFRRNDSLLVAGHKAIIITKCKPLAKNLSTTITMLSKTLLLLFSLLGFASASLTAFDPSSGGADAAGSKNSRIGGRGLSSSQEKEFRKLMEGAAFDGRSVLETCGATLDLFDLLECTSTTIWYGSVSI